jgi:hypothetical protein
LWTLPALITPRITSHSPRRSDSERRSSAEANNLIAAFDPALDHGDGGELWKTRRPRIGALGSDPIKAASSAILRADPEPILLCGAAFYLRVHPLASHAPEAAFDPQMYSLGLVNKPDQETIDKFLTEIRLLSVRDMRLLFPDAEIVRERFCGFTKSIIAMKRS